MESSLYKKLFARMDELGAIRKDLTDGCRIILHEEDIYIQNNPGTYIEDNGQVGVKDAYACDSDTINWIAKQEERGNINDAKIIGHDPVLSDCMKSLDPASENGIILGGNRHVLISKWDLEKPFLREQSDELGEALYSLIK